MNKMKRRVAVIDAETDPFAKGRIPEPFIWGFYDGEGPVQYFERTDDLVAFIREQPLIIYAHNGGRFDYHLGILKHLEPYSAVTLINGRLARFNIGLAEFRDSVNILPMALKDFRKDDIDYAKLERDVRHKHMPEIKRYLATDCEALFELVSEFRNSYGNSLTLASAAMKYWQKLSDTESIANHDSDFFATFQPFYVGGRVQCFRPGIYEGPFVVLDINSAYPYAMMHDHPFSRSYEAIDNPRKDGKIIPQSFYHVQGRALRGFAPLRNDKGACKYPDDGQVYTYHITGWELLAGVETQSFDIHKILTRYDFPVIDNFKVYIDHFYTIKRTAKRDTPPWIFSKFMLNALYGKHGSNPDNYDSYGIVPVEFAEAAQCDDELTMGKHTGTWEAIGTLGPWALMRSELYDDEKFYYNVATAASITGFVRAFLWRALHKVKQNGGTLLYCDTDSIAFAGDASWLPTDDALGNWKHEGNFVSAAIAGKKLYAFELAKPDKKGNTFKTASKGVKLTAAQIFELARGGEIDYESDVPTFSPSKPPSFVKRKTRRTYDR